LGWTRGLAAEGSWVGLQPAHGLSSCADAEFPAAAAADRSNAYAIAKNNSFVVRGETEGGRGRPPSQPPTAAKNGGYNASHREITIYPQKIV
jgi:hypothetical protein